MDHRQPTQTPAERRRKRTDRFDAQPIALSRANRRGCGLMSPRQMIVCAVFLSLFIFLLNPLSESGSADALKLKKKEKKVLKSLVKGLLVKKLTTKKNFMPLPVPIPGKWQPDNHPMRTLANVGLMLASELGKGNKHTSSTSRIFGSDNGQTNRRKFSAGASAGGSNVSKFDDRRKSVFPTSLSLRDMEKYARLVAAKYASKLISQQPSTSGSAVDKTAIGKAIAAAAASATKGKLGNKKSSSGSVTDAGSTRNDLLVTVFNLVKLLQQFKEIDRSQLLNVAKLSILSPNKRQPSLLSMNINNRKSFINKMNYIHTLTTEFNHRRHRHRLSNNLNYLF